MLDRLTILKKGLLLIAVPLCFQMAFITMVAVMRRNAVSAEAWMLHTKDVFVQRQALWSKMITAHGSLQGYVITRDAAFDRLTVDQIRGVDQEAARLTHLVADNPAQKAKAAAIEAEVNRFSRFLNEGVSLLRDGKMEMALAMERRKHSQESLERMDHLLSNFLEEEQRLDRIRHAELDQAWSRLDVLLAAGTITSILFSLLLVSLFAKSISGRISALAANVHRLGEGKALAAAVGGDDEIARLDRVFHEMARTLDRAAQTERENARMTALRAEELATLNDQLREKNQENEMFVYSVSHDLRSPLVNLQGFSKELGLIGKDLRSTLDRDDVPRNLRDRAIGMIDVDISESIQFIQSAVTRLSGIIDALLRLSRAGRVEYRFQTTDIAGIVRRVVSALGQTIQEKGATVHVGDLPMAYGDPTAMEQVLGNLIGNALNYLDPARPGVISISAAPAPPDHPIAPPGTVIFAIQDNGMGIPDAYKSKVFSVFQRLHGDHVKGEGIGLALVRRMVERHGGRVWFESVAGQGSTFFVAFPAEPVSSRDPSPSVLSSGLGSEKEQECPSNP
ncbi:sensor histidine kinase [Tundrisphaera sp. TA3]|uniref:sensor histidine kinase n=1 Tax=Tundrisphaera sp. TA3 TaxID=3435775 RepID=UPI003EBBD77B